MGPRTGSGYSRLSEDQSTCSGFEELAEDRLVQISLDSNDGEANTTGDSNADYWTKLRGMEKILGVFVRLICSGHMSVVLLLFSILLAGGLGLIAVLLNPVQLNTSLSSFEIPDHKVYKREDAFDVALGHRPSDESTQLKSHRRRREAPASPFLNPGERQIHKWKINLIYLTKDGGSIFRKEIIERIHEIEKKVEKSIPDYPKFCWLKSSLPLGTRYPNPLNACLPLNSLLSYFYRWDGRTDAMAYNGDVTKAARNAMHLAGSRFFWYVDSSHASANGSHLLRSQIILGRPLHDSWRYGTPRQIKAAEHAVVKKFIVSLVPFLSHLSDK